MRVLVTGWAGYIGPVVVRKLAERGHLILGLDMLLYYGEWPDPPAEYFPHREIGNDIREWHGDDDYDAVVHLAGLSNDPLGALDPGLTEAINARATLQLIFQHPRARHVFVSSCSVYGASGAIGTADETFTPMPLTAYARSKADVDRVLHDSLRPAFDAVSVRFGTVYGWAPNYRLDLVVNRMIDDALTTGAVNVTSDAARPLVHVEDAAEAVVMMVEGSATGIYNVAAENVRIGDLGERIAALMDCRLDRIKDVSDARDYAVVADRIRELGWAPTHTVEGHVAEMTARGPLPPGPYHRLRALDALIQSGRLDRQLRWRVAA